MSDHLNTGWIIVPSDDTSPMECCADEDRVFVEVYLDGVLAFCSSPHTVTGVEVMINCARHYRPQETPHER